MQKYKCIKELYLPIYDESECPTDEYATIHEGSLVDMSRVRMCSRAYHEYRKMFNDICNALTEYSDEWK